MKITLESTDSLDDALRVIGALHRVRLTVAEETATENVVPAEPNPPRKTAAARRRRSRAAAAKSNVANGAGSRRRRTRTAAAAPKTADVRAWARENGHQVSDRGPISADVVVAYQEAN